MWALLELIFLIALVLVSITEFFIPLVSGKPMFGSFRKTKPTETKITDESLLDEKISKTREKVEEVKEEVMEVQQQVAENFKTAKQLKKESDNLLK